MTYNWKILLLVEISILFRQTRKLILAMEILFVN